MRKQKKFINGTNAQKKGVIDLAEYNKGKFFWIKLTDDFLTSDTVDFLMAQKEGANYVVLYQMLCLKTVNNDGILGRQLGEIIVEYDAEKICRDCKYFSIDTVRVALELYKKLGLVYEYENGLLRITDFENLIGSKSIGAEKKKLQREAKKALEIPENTEGGQKVDKCPPEIERYIDKEIYKEKDKKNIYKSIRRIYGEYKNVLLSDEDMDKLKDEFPDDYEERIERLSFYIKSTGKSYKDHLATIRNWARKDKEKGGNNGTVERNGNKNNFEEWTGGAGITI